MTIEAEFAELMVDTVLVAKLSARSAYGDRTYGADVSYEARVVVQNKMVRTQQGDEVVSRSHAYIFGAPGITVDDRVTLADGSQPVLLSVEQFPDENGAHHEVLYFGGSG
jgi:hypothetical protein